MAIKIRGIASYKVCFEIEQNMTKEEWEALEDWEQRILIDREIGFEENAELEHCAVLDVEEIK